jgi:hypothetical protein
MALLSLVLLIAIAGTALVPVMAQLYDYNAFETLKW